MDPSKLTTTGRLTEGENGWWYYVVERGDGSVVWSKRFRSREAFWHWMLSPNKTAGPELAAGQDYKIPPMKRDVAG